MRRALGLLAAAGLALACAPAPQRTFFIGIQAPLGARDQAAARRLGVRIVSAPPPGAALESASSGPGGQMASWSRLRYLGALAAARGKAGIIFVLPRLAAGREFADYPEEWQALARAVRELKELQPRIEAGTEEPSPLTAPGVEGRAWRYASRRYMVLVNASDAAVLVDEKLLSGWRALFETRADPRELLRACPGGGCLAPGRALWLEGRPAWPGRKS